MKAFGALLLTVAVPATSWATTWDIDGSHTTVSFKVRHMMVTDVRGEFGKVEGKVDINDKDLSKSNVDVTIDVGSVNTRDEKRDGHLKSPDFFDVAKHSKITFKSTKVASAGKGKLKVTGNLTIKGVTKKVTLDVSEFTKEIKGPWGSYHRGATATTTIDRKDFGITWNKNLDAGGLLVGNEVKIMLDVELVRKANS